MSKIKISEVMKRATFLRFEGKIILKYDLSDLKCLEDIKKVFNYFSGMVERMPAKSMSCLLDVTGLDDKVVSVANMALDIEKHSSHFKAAAVVARDVTSKELIKTVRDKMAIYLPIYEEESQATEWLLTL